MDTYSGLRFKGIVKKEFRDNFFKIAMDGDWKNSNNEKFRSFGKYSKSSFIPLGGLSFMPDSWKNGEKNPILTSYDVNTGYWEFQCSLKNINLLVEKFLDLVPYFAESVKYCELYHFPLPFSFSYELSGNELVFKNFNLINNIELKNEKFKKNEDFERMVYPMANNCLFDMKICGKEKDVNEFLGLINSQNLGRIYQFVVVDSAKSNNGLLEVQGTGDCAWSILSSMREKYRNDRHSLESESKRLGLVIEAFSLESGIGFQEHFLIDRGNVLIDECVNYFERYVEAMSEEEICKFINEQGITMDEFKEGVNINGDYCVGGFDNYCDFKDLTVYFDESCKSIDEQIKAAENEKIVSDNVVKREELSL